MNYRTFTDRPEDEVPKVDLTDEEEQKLELLGRGFKAFLPQAAASKTTTSNAEIDGGKDGLCVYRGESVWN